MQNGKYSFTEWSKESPAGTYPPSMIFLQSKTKDPKLSDSMDSRWTYAYNISSKSRLVGQGAKGVSFINTSTVQADGGGFLGETVLGINTTDRKNIKVSWKCRTLSTWDRQYAITFRYAIGSDSLIQSNIIYYASPTKDDSASFSLVLPESAENVPLVYLNWKYYSTDDSSGNRPNLGLDDIFVEAESISGIENRSAENMYSYSNGIIHFCIYAEEIEVFDLNGKTICRWDKPSSEIHIAQFPAGVYFIYFKIAGKEYRHKLLKTD